MPIIRVRLPQRDVVIGISILVAVAGFYVAVFSQLANSIQKVFLIVTSLIEAYYAVKAYRYELPFHRKWALIWWIWAFTCLGSLYLIIENMENTPLMH